jgi:hypothetical protein
MTVQKSVGLIGPLAIGATDARLTAHLVTYIVRTFEKKTAMDTHETLNQIRKEEKKFQIIHEMKQKSKRSRISSPGFHIDAFFFLNKRIQEQAIQARFKLGWQSLPCSS